MQAAASLSSLILLHTIYMTASCVTALSGKDLNTSLHGRKAASKTSVQRQLEASRAKARAISALTDGANKGSVTGSVSGSVLPNGSQHGTLVKRLSTIKDVP
jgi:hypothetical protein